jgi:4-hydroxy-tetrahydrodipicolinate synthase
MPVIDFKGSWTALITPFDQRGDVDYKGLQKNIEFQVDQGITGVLPVGTTGESPTLKESEHNEVVKRAKIYAADRCDIFAGTGSNSTREALHYCKNALDSGIDKVLLVDCYYNGPSSLELRDEYYKTILDEYKDINIVIYVIPGRTGTAISSVDIAVLSEQYDRVIAIKEATGDIARMEEERSLMPEMSIMSGDDDKTLEMMTSSKIKAKGVISVSTNIAPKAVSQMVNALLSGDMEKGKSLAQKLKPLFSIVTVKTNSKRTLKNGTEIVVQDRFRNPLAIKTAMNALGIPAGHPRKPLGKMTKAGADVVRDALKSVYQNSPEILTPLEEFYGINIEERLNDDSAWEKLVY